MTSERMTSRDERLQRRLAAALGSHQRGEMDSAQAQYRDILKDHPRCFDALHLLGILCSTRGAADEGLALLSRALALDPSRADAHYSLAMAFLGKGDDRSALPCLDRAVTLKPDFVEGWFSRGNLLQQSDRAAEAIESYQRAARLRPAFPEAFNNLAAAQRALRELAPALDSVNRALALRPAYPKALNNRGLILLDCRRGSEAIGDFRRALALEPAFPEALHNLGTALMQLRRFEEARDAFAQLTRAAPGFRHGAGNLLFAKLSCCDWSDFEAQVDAVVRAVERGEHAAVPMHFLCLCDSPTLQLRCARTYTGAYHPPRPAPQARLLQHDRVRIAYLSGDFGEHAVSYLLAGVFEQHDAARFETIALSWDRRGEGSIRRRVECAFSRFIDVTATSDDSVARLLRELEVDIAVDLMGHTLGQRTGILARRAAPVQINFLGLPATMGSPYIDYLIADRFLVPEDRLAEYAEQVVWLPDCFQPNDDRRDLAPGAASRDTFGLPEDGFVFCSFNRNNKINPCCFDVWMRLLGAVPGSVLWLLATHPSTEGNLRREAQARGIDPHRLLFAGEAPYAEYLARYALADLFLDTLPFNGGTTISDALSMGLPVLTCVGQSFAARMAGSVLTSLGLSELATGSLPEYEAAALSLATNPDHLRSLRAQLERRRSGHAFFDTDRYRRHLEAAYRAMWERHAAALPPATLAMT